MLRLNLRTVRITRRNFEIAYPSLSTAEREQLIRRTLREQGALSAEMGHVWRRPHDYVRSLISVNGGDHVDLALAEGRGVVVLALINRCRNSCLRKFMLIGAIRSLGAFSLLVLEA